MKTNKVLIVLVAVLGVGLGYLFLKGNKASSTSGAAAKKAGVSLASFDPTNPNSAFGSYTKDALNYIGLNF